MTSKKRKFNLNSFLETPNKNGTKRPCMETCQRENTFNLGPTLTLRVASIRKKIMSEENLFPEHLLLNQPGRRQKLIQTFYEAHHKNRNLEQAKDDEKKLAFFLRSIVDHQVKIGLGIDIGCRGGVLTRRLSEHGRWVGLDIDRNAIAMANAAGIPCAEMDVSTAIDLVDDCADAVCLTEVLEHLPYPSVTLHEIWRILKKQPQSVFFGSVPIDYHLHRRIAVMRGKRLTFDPTHLRSFSFSELKALLEHYFEHVEFAAMRGTKTRHPWLSWQHFVRDIAWFARGPRRDLKPWDICVIE